MSIGDKDLPFALIDLVVAVVQAVMGVILMSFVASYFALTLPPIVFIVWRKGCCLKLSGRLLTSSANSYSEALSTDLPPSSTP